MLSLFKKAETPAKLAKAAAAAEQRRDRLTERLGAAEVAANERELVARNAALGGADDATLDKLESELQNARQRVKTFADALAVAEREVAEDRARLADANDRALRAETVAKVAEMAADVERAGIEIEAALGHLAEATGAAGVIVPEAIGVKYFCESAQGELNGAVANVLDLLASHSRGVAEGHLPGGVPGQEVPAPKSKPAPIATMNIFPTENLKWTEGAATRVTPRYYGISVPLHIGQRAISLGLAVETDSPRAKQLQHLGGARVVHPDDAISIDEVIDDVAQTSSPRPSEPFEMIDCGAPIAGEITVSRVA